MSIRPDCAAEFLHELCQAVGGFKNDNAFVFRGDFSDFCGATAALDREKTVECEFIRRKSAGGNGKSQGGNSRYDLRLNARFDRLPNQKKTGIRDTWSPRIHFHGMVDDAKKRTVILRSKGLVFPVTWHEPFGLAITESLYMGAPVFGTPYGSLPELVPPEVGFLTNSEPEMAERMKSANSFSPRTCHEYARDMFNSGVMAEAYLKK